MTKKLAVLISGRYRNFDEIWKINKILIDQLDVPYEVFFHCWSDNPKSTRDVLSADFKNRPYFSVFPKSEIIKRSTISKEFTQETFGFSFVKIDDFNEIDIAERFHLGTAELNSLFNSQINSCGMFVGIDECVKAMQQVGGFTHFLRLRTDFSLGTTGLNKIFDHDLVFFGQLLPTEEGPIGDQCYGGSLKHGAYVLKTLETLGKMTSDLNWNIKSPIVLSENVVRLTIMGFRQKSEIIYCNGLGQITRPKLRNDITKFSLNYLEKILFHNLRFIKWALSRFKVKFYDSLKSKE